MSLATLPLEMMTEVHRRAKLYVQDNLTNPTPHDLLYTINAMSIGATIGLELAMKIQVDETKTDERTTEPVAPDKGTHQEEP